MQKRSRRPHGLRSRKISVSVSADDLRILSRRAKRFYGGNLSAVVHELVLTLKREQAVDELLNVIGGDEISEADMQAIRNEVAAAPVRRRKGRTAA